MSAKYEMRDVIVLLPGITGSVLKKEGKVVWGYSAGTISKALFKLGGAAGKALALPNDDPVAEDLGDGITATALMPDLHLLPGVCRIDGYRRITTAIKRNFKVTEGRNFFDFPYDWRRDNRVSARKLARMSHDWLSAWRQSSSNSGAKLILIAHSMGGLVSRYFLECLEGWKDTRALVTFGTPYLGSLAALDGLSNGLARSPVELSNAARQFTSLYQLLPVYECYDLGDGRLRRIGETSGIPNVDPVKSADALAFHREIQAAVAANRCLPRYHSDGYWTYPIFGVGQPTGTFARLVNGRVQFSGSLPNYQVDVAGGDGTVPLISAIPSELTGSLSGALCPGTRHGSLQNADAAIAHLAGILSGCSLEVDVDRGGAPKPAAQVALEVGDIYLPHEPVFVRARPAEENVTLNVMLWRKDVAQPVAKAELRSVGGGLLGVDLPSLAPGAYRVTVGGKGVETAEDSFLVASASPLDLVLPAKTAAQEVRLAERPALATDWRRLISSLNLNAGRKPKPAPADSAPPDSTVSVTFENDGDDGNAPPTVKVTLSAEADDTVAIDAFKMVAFQIELTLGAQPLSTSIGVIAQKDKPIVVCLSVENDAVEIIGEQRQTVLPPEPGEPRTGFFRIKGLRAGPCRLAVAFRQGGTDLGVIGLKVSVAQNESAPKRAKGSVAAEPRDPADDDKLALLVWQRMEKLANGEVTVYYEYLLHSETLGLAYKPLKSKPLLDQGGTPVATMLAYINHVYAIVTAELKNLDDLKELDRKTQQLGTTLCRELIAPDVAAVLWPLRKRIKLVQIVTWEPYIPWELVRLQDPVSGKIDDRFLCEYGLVRTLSDHFPIKELRLSNWAYLVANFPSKTYPPIGAELDYFTRNEPQNLPARGITPRPIPATRDAFYSALANCGFDVLHISCHAEASEQSIEEARLIIGEEPDPGGQGTRLVEVSPDPESAPAFKAQRPLVFLNACETGRTGPVLTAWGGWPNVFMRAGAAAFVGAAWAVRDKPAAAFSTAFYNALFDGKTLSEAADAARAAAKKFGESSWLAFKVYGHPRARRVDP